MVLSGVHGCYIESVAASEAQQQVSTLHSSLRLSVVLARSDGQPELHSDTFDFDFLPTFHVHNAELHLSTLSPLGSIRVSTVPQVMETIQVNPFI